MPPPLRFIVLATARTGSTLLLELLGGHPAVRVFGEPFNFLSISRKAADRAMSDPLAYLHAALHPAVPPDVRAVGFKIFYHHPTPQTFDPSSASVYLATANVDLRERIERFLEHAASRFDVRQVARGMEAVWASLADDKEIRVIHLKRANLLRVHLSYTLAYLTDQWHQRSTRRHPPMQPPVRLDADECQAAFERIRRLEQGFDERFSLHPLVQVSYEELAANRTSALRDLFAFLELEPLEVGSDLQQQDRRSLRDAISNFDELRERFAGGPWSSFFEETPPRRARRPRSPWLHWNRWLRARRRGARAARRTAAQLRAEAAHCAGELTRIGGRSDPAFLRSGGPVVVVVVRNEALRLPWFLEHYRALGFAGFVAIDHKSTDDTKALLEARDDVLLFAAAGDYRAARYGASWANALLDRYLRGRWVLLADADEALVVPGGGGIGALVEGARRRRDRSVFTPLVDVYPSGPISDAHYAAGTSPLSVADCMDAAARYRATVYPTRWDPRAAIVDLRGGPRARTFGFGEDKPPLLTKVSLVQADRGVYWYSSHHVFPAARNTPKSWAPLLHFKFLHDFHERCAWAVRAKQHWQQASEYRAYLEHLERDPQFAVATPDSLRYREPDSLAWLGERYARWREEARAI